MTGYYFITDSRLSRSGNLSDCRNAVKAGVKIVQYRNKSGSGREMFEEALCLRKICRKTTFLINDRLDITIAVNADGVHLGQDDLSCKIARKILGRKKIIGVTVHDLKQAKTAAAAGADYLAAGPIFSTGTKHDAGRPVGVSLINKIKKSVHLPVIAIGGINLANAPKVISAGADGICAISAVVAKPDVGKEIRKFQGLFLRY